MFHTYLKLLCSVANAVPNSRQNLKCHILAPNPILCCNLRFTKFLKCSSTLEVNNKWRFDHFSWPTTHGQPYCTDRSSLHWIISYYFAEVAKICPHARILLVKMKRKGIWNGLHQNVRCITGFLPFAGDWSHCTVHSSSRKEKYGCYTTVWFGVLFICSSFDCLSWNTWSEDVINKTYPYFLKQKEVWILKLNNLCYQSSS